MGFDAPRNSDFGPDKKTGSKPVQGDALRFGLKSLLLLTTACAGEMAVISYSKSFAVLAFACLIAAALFCMLGWQAALLLRWLPANERHYYERVLWSWIVAILLLAIGIVVANSVDFGPANLPTTPVSPQNYRRSTALRPCSFAQQARHIS
jgi:hypothetical protein